MSEAGEISATQEDRVGQLATSLVAELGLEGAVSVCRNNHWLGVLKRIENQPVPKQESESVGQARTA